MSNTKTIDFKLGSWLENASIVGLTRILPKSEYKIDNNVLHVDTDVFDSFADYYFKFFIDTYGFGTRYQRILNMKDKLLDWQDNDFKDFNENDLKQLLNWFSDALFYSIKQASVIKVIDTINSDFDVIAETKDCNKLIRTLKKKNELVKNHDEAIETLKLLITKLLPIFTYFNAPEAHKLFPATNLSYQIIKNAWDGVSFLNHKTKSNYHDLYEDFQDYFANSVKKYLTDNHDKDKYICANCGLPIGNHDKLSGYSFLTGMGFDVTRKSSNAWNFEVTSYLCPICRLLYTCVSAGFTYNFTYQGIFINSDSSIDELKAVNDKVLLAMTTALTRKSATTPYQAFTSIFQDKAIESEKYVLANVQVVSYAGSKDDGIYTFRVIPVVASEVLKYAAEHTFSNGSSMLDTLYAAGVKGFKGQNYYNIFSAVVDKLLNGTNLTSLIHDLLLLKATNTDGCYYSIFQVFCLIRMNSQLINKILQKKGEQMQVTEEKLSKMRSCGAIIREEYAKFNENKSQSLAYHMLDALRANNVKRFMDLLLNTYLYLNKIVPRTFIDSQTNIQVFEQYGYAFVAGLIGKIDKN